MSSALEFGYGAGVQNAHEKIAQDTMWCKYERARRAPLTFRDECIRTAEIVKAEADALGRPVYLLLSGGLDSQVTAKAFIEAGIDFQAITFRLQNVDMAGDLFWVQEFCERHGIETEPYDIDIMSWSSTAEAKAMFVDSHAHFFEMIPHMKLLEHVYRDLRGYPVLGNGDVFLENTGAQWQYVEFEYILAWHRFAVQRGIEGSIEFFQHTPEIILAGLHDPIISDLGSNQNKLANSVLKDGRELKYKMYRKFWPDFARRRKLNGGELIHPFYETVANKIRRSRSLTYNDKWTMPFAEFKKNFEPHHSL